MINQIKIKNFKSIKDLTMQSKSLNLFMGLNGMGKSSFIQTLLLLRQNTNSGLSRINLNGIYTNIGKGKDAFYQYSQEETIEIEVQIIDYWCESRSIPCELTYQPESNVFTNNNKWSTSWLKSFSLFNHNFQYLEAERTGPKTDYPTSYSDVMDEHQLGIQGEYTVHYLNAFGNSIKVPKELQHPQAKSDILIHQVSAWLGEISPGIKINTTEISGTDRVILDYQFAHGNQYSNSFRPQNVGFGISYVLPVITALLSYEWGKLIIVENPESHIHPKGQAAMGRLLALAAAKDMQLFIETHSDHIVNGIRVAVKQGLVDKSKVNIAYFTKTSTESEQFTSVHTIKVDEKGELNEYPEDFMDEWNNQLLELI